LSQKVVKKIVRFLKRAGISRGNKVFDVSDADRPQAKKGIILKILSYLEKTERNSKRAAGKREKYEGFPRPGGDFVAPGKNGGVLRDTLECYYGGQVF
jgi:hypothetical protein